MNCLKIISWIAICFCAATSSAQSPPVSLTEDCRIEFASSDVGRKLIVLDCAYLERMQDAERSIRMKKTRPATQAEFLASLRKGVKEFSESEIESTTKAITLLHEKMLAFDLPFPKQIDLIRVGAEIEFDAPHCRGTSVILPDSFFENEKRMPTILAHEFFHVLSSQNPKLRDRLYALISFEPCNEVELPPSLIERRMTNPDAPVNQHIIRLKNGDETIDAMPIIFLKSMQYRGGGLMDYLRFELMVVQKEGQGYAPKLADGAPILLPMDRSTNYLAKIGRNTSYIIHPEETLADNFWMMVLGSTKVEDRWVIDGMAKILRRGKAK